MISISAIKTRLSLFIMCFATYMSAQNEQLDAMMLALDTASTYNTKLRAIKDLGYYYQDAKGEKAIEYFNEGFELAKINNDSLQMANILYGKAFTYTRLNQLTKALSGYFDAVRIYEELEDYWRLGNTYMAITNVYVSNGNLKKQMEYLDLAEDLAITHGDSIQLSYFYNQKGVIYDQANKLDSAVVFLKKSLDIGYAINDTVSVIMGHTNLGLTYKHLNKNEKALNAFRSALDYSSKENNDYNLSIIYNNLGATYLQTDDLDLAEEAFLQSISFATNAQAKNVLLENYKNLAELFEKKKAFEAHSDYLKQYYTLKDSLYTVAKETELSQIESDYVIEKKDLQLETQKLALEKKSSQNTTYIVLFIFSVLTLGLLLVYYTKSRKKNQLLISKNTLIHQQKEALEHTLKDLKLTQAQLIQSEKMASLGELTAGIAHEIQNPLNFVNNFSEVSTELIDEMNEEIKNENFEEVTSIAKDVKTNLEKINIHGKRADSIVKGMLQHSRNNSGIKEPTDINKLTDEYLRLAYHGLRAKDKSFNSELETTYDDTIGTVEIVAQDLGRVVLNLITNAFYAVNEKQKLLEDNNYKPTVSVKTINKKQSFEIEICDNGNGIPKSIINKIFEPFFTTKPTGQGTGLGLSMSYDIIKAHGGELRVETNDGEGSAFIIEIPKLQ